MKKGILIYLLLISPFVLSQDFGFHFGMNLSTQLNKDKVQNNSKELDYKNVFGVNFGFDYKTKIGQNVFFQTGLTFIQNGFKHDRLNINGGSYLAKSATLNYLKVPLLLLADKKTTKVGPNIKFGGYISYLIGGDYNVLNSPIETPLNKEFKKLDFGITGGIGLKINKFTLDFIYNLGLNNIAEDGDNNFIETVIKNRNFNVNLIYWIY
ncbi:PorT family protein [Polaribacter pectinis]|uniref:PorT family protein n=1 Tax=Polaribacter pectinis TaxID=2738844 RepID=A0A7G9LCY9_9FLAO|nr:porin family protein [Polaribacter pectinis]QNM86488.1 PorT family protein [Polaribacter pectinis]